MDHPFKFVAALAGLFLVTPLAILLATGSLRKMLEAARGYGLVMLLLTVPGALLGLFAGWIGWLS